MRTLQRLSHVRVPNEQEAQRIHNAERRSVARKERRIWTRRAQLVARLAALALLAFLVLRWVWGGRFLAEGLVEANLVVARAPAAVRVAEVLCAVGQRCERGTPLVRLESIAPREERRPLELALEQRRLRLELVEAGGDLGDTDIARRADRVAQAEREAQLAEGERRVAQAALETQIRRKVALELALREEQAENGGAAASLEERVAAAQALIEKAGAETEFTDWDAGKRLELNTAGVLSERDMVEALSARGAAASEVEGLSASARALVVELEAARNVVLLGGARIAATTAEMDARLGEENARVQAATERRELWRELAARQRELGATAQPGEGERLRELELRLLSAEVAEAEARLAEHDGRAGDVLVRAETGGLVERVFVGAGEVAEAGEPLVRYYEPERMRVIAYFDRDHADEPRPGRECRIRPVGSRRSLAGRVVAVDEVWTPCPALLPQERGAGADLRLAVEVECVAPGELATLRPNGRVRILFADDAAVSQP